MLEALFSWWTFRIFFFCSGEGKGESEAPGAGGGLTFHENPRRGGVSGRVGPGAGEGPGGCLWGIFGGGLNIFFRGRNVRVFQKRGMRKI